VQSAWSVYLVRCGDGSLYTGIATDVVRRLDEHRQARGKGAKYLRGRGPLRVVFERVIGPRGLASKVESKIKKLAKGRKEVLIRETAVFEALVAEVQRSSSRHGLEVHDGLEVPTGDEIAAAIEITGVGKE
jgi:putative endonuclease